MVYSVTLGGQLFEFKAELILPPPGSSKKAEGTLRRWLGYERSGANLGSQGLLRFLGGSVLMLSLPGGEGSSPESLVRDSLGLTADGTGSSDLGRGNVSLDVVHSVLLKTMMVGIRGGCRSSRGRSGSC